ncbi:hypothetical protein Tco_1305909, partial [Tanacetum coccineum]
MRTIQTWGHKESRDLFLRFHHRRTTYLALRDHHLQITCLALRSQSRHHLHLFTYLLFRSLFTRSSYRSPTHQSPGYIPESDLEEDPADYPADRGDDDDDDAEEEHLAPADPAATPAPFLSEEVAERFLALPTPPPSPLSPYSSPLPQIPSPPLPIPPPPPISPTYVEGSLGSRASRIRQRDALPPHVHEIVMPDIGLPLRKRLCRTTPGPGYEVGESSAAGTARRVRPTTTRTNLYGFADTLEAAPGRRMS